VEEEHFVVAVSGGEAGGKLTGGAPAVAGRLEDAGAEVLRNELKLVRRKAAGEAPGFGAEGGFRGRNERGNQMLALGNHTNYGDLSRIIANSSGGCKGPEVPSGPVPR
jgi:hypothetical protein